MPRTRQAVAQKVADRLFALENAIDLALTRSAELNASMPEARGEARLPALVGQDALDGRPRLSRRRGASPGVETTVARRARLQIGE